MTVLTFDEIVAGMRAQGVPVEMAERAARRELGQTGPIAGAEIETDALEDVHVNEGKRLVRALGGFVYSSVQKRRAKVTPGQPDTLFFFPKHRLMVWWEAKASWGRQSSAQKLFEELCEGCGAHYVCGTFEVFEAWLITYGIGRKERDGTWTPLPFHPLIDT
jgi:hypothetical protein